MLSKFKSRMQNQANNQNYYNQMPNMNPYNNGYQNYNQDPMGYKPYNEYDLARIDEQINELKRINSDLLKRLNRLENYLGIKTIEEASNYN